MTSDEIRALVTEGNIAIDEAFGDKRPLVSLLADMADALGRVRCETSGHLTPHWPDSLIYTVEELVARFGALGDPTAEGDA